MKIWPLPLVSVVAALGCLLVTPSRTVASTYTVDADSVLQFFGASNYATAGQTFVAPESKLESWSFQLQHAFGTDLDFRFFVMEWDSANYRASGPVLYQSATFTSAPGPMTSFSVNPNLDLLVGTTYVAFLNQSGLNPGELALTDMALSSNGAPLGGLTTGSFVYLDNGDDFAALTTRSWFNDLASNDAAYSATFSNETTSVPDGGPTAFLIAMALVLTGVAQKRIRSGSVSSGSRS